MTATGGTITTDGDYTVHTFTSSGTFTVTVVSSLAPTDAKIDYDDAKGILLKDDVNIGDTGTTYTLKINGVTVTPGGGGSATPYTIYSSQLPGIHADSDIDTGGGTDDTAILQTALDTLHTLGGGTLVIEGVSLVTDALFDPDTHWGALQVYSNTHIIFNPGAGLFLDDHCNIPIISAGWGVDPLVTNTGKGYYVENVTISGGILNCNASNQDKTDSVRWWPFGIVFANFSNVTLEDLEVRNAKTFSIVFTAGQVSTSKHVRVRNVRSFWNEDTTGSSNKDGLHLWGTLDDIIVDGYFSNGDDDALALNCDEGVAGYVNNFGYFLFAPTSGGDITNATFENCEFRSNTGGGIHTYRVLYDSVGTANCKNLRFINIIGDSGIPCGGFSVQSLDTMSFNGFYVPNGSIAATCTNFGAGLIIPSADLSGVTATNKFGDYYA